MLRLVAFLLAILLPTLTYACTRAALPQSAYAAVPADRIDLGRLNAAVLAEVNYERCQQGLRPLASADTRLLSVTMDHSAWMASKGTLSHKSNVRGRRTLGDRLKASRMRVRTASENIAVLSRYQFGQSRFRVLDSRQCQFADRAGRQIAPHSYASLARTVVGLWMQSAGHRRNILDRKVTRVSTSAAFGNSQHCGQFWVTQNFVG